MKKTTKKYTIKVMGMFGLYSIDFGNKKDAMNYVKAVKRELPYFSLFSWIDKNSPLQRAGRD